jgi:hypothetical protein
MEETSGHWNTETMDLTPISISTFLGYKKSFWLLI